MGRHRSEKEALRSTVAAVVNRQEREQIEAVCAATGKSISEVVRQGLRVALGYVPEETKGWVPVHDTHQPRPEMPSTGDQPATHRPSGLQETGLVVLDCAVKIGRLHPREAEVLGNRLGLSDVRGKPMTLAEIAERLCRTKERVRQIVKKAERKIKGGCARYPLREVIVIRECPMGMGGECTEACGAGKLIDAPIENLDFSVRTYNCLKKEKIDTLGILLDQTDEDLLSIRNLGKCAWVEIIDKLADMHLSLKPSVTDGSCVSEPQDNDPKDEDDDLYCLMHVEADEDGDE